MKEANEFEQLKIEIIKQHEAIYKLEKEIMEARMAYIRLEGKICQKNSFQYYNEILPKIRNIRDRMTPPEDQY